MVYDKICLETFLKNQAQLFDEPVADTLEEKNKKEVKKYFKENLDASGMTDEEILEACEVFPLPDGRFLVVEG